MGHKTNAQVSRLTAKLQADGWIEIHHELTPKVYRLSRSGAQLLEQTFSRDWYSASAIHQYLLRSEIEMQWQDISPKATIMPRPQLYKLGLNPAHAEHALYLPENKSIHFFILDDYYIKPDRIRHKWERKHTANTKYFSSSDNSMVYRWNTISNAFSVYTTDKMQMDKHSKVVAKYNLPAEIKHIKPLWTVA